MNNRIRIARTGQNTYIGNADESLKLQTGQPFYDVHSNRLYISNENDKKIRELINSNGVTAYQADRFVTPRSLKTKLDSTTAITFDGSANQDAIPVVGVLPVANGGTGVSDNITESNITVKNATLAVDAINVKSKINNKNISDIFESDGVTVKSTTNANKINNLEITRDDKGILKIGDIIIPQKLPIQIDSAAYVSSTDTYDIVFKELFNVGDTIELNFICHWTTALNSNYDVTLKFIAHVVQPNGRLSIDIQVDSISASNATPTSLYFNILEGIAYSGVEGYLYRFALLHCNLKDTGLSSLGENRTSGLEFVSAYKILG